MGRYIPDGVLKVRHVPSIANKEAPTDTELAAGDDLTAFLRGLETPFEGSTVDVSDVSSKFNKTAAGTYGGQPLTAEFYRDDEQANDTAFNLLPRGTTGYFVIARRGGSGTDGAIAVGDLIDVWPIEVITRNPSPYRRNEPTAFGISCAVPDVPEEDVAVVAAGP